MMFMSYLLPTRILGSIEDGAFIKALEFCKKNCNTGCCRTFYDNISSSDYNKFIICPHGMSVFVFNDGDKTIPFVCLRCRDYYNKNKAKQINNPEDQIAYNPLLDADNLLELINYSVQSQYESNQFYEKRTSLESISHEAKKLNAQVKDRSDAILQSYNIENIDSITPQDVRDIIEKVKTIYVCSSMINMRFSLLNYEKNPQVLQQGAMYSCNIYRKFDKTRIIFSNYLGRRVHIQIHGNSYKCIDVYPFFEMVPLLLVDNAVKYSYEKTSVQINFSEKNDSLFVEIISYGPFCPSEDIQNIFAKGYRGEYAKSISDGSGIGLFFVKLLCDLHGIGISISSNEKEITTINDIPYAPFKVTLTFTNTYDEFRL